LRAKVRRAVRQLGYPEGEAGVIVDVLIYAQLRGNNQGLAKLATGGVPRAGQAAPFAVVKQGDLSALLTGGQAMVTAAKAADLAARMAAERGIGLVAANDSLGSSGAIGYYARRIAEAGLIGFIAVGTGALRAVAPTGSAEPRLGTNPLAYAFPYDGGVVVFDTATAAMARFGVIEHWLRGEPLPEGMAFDGAGQPTTDPAAVLGAEAGAGGAGGAVTPFGGHRGYGLSLAVQLLGGPFALAAFPGAAGAGGQGFLALALDPGLLSGRQEYMARASELVASVKAARPLPGQQVLMPGERGDQVARQAEEMGYLDIADGIWLKFLELLGEGPAEDCP
jgi:LDH2 family malate/lactate/ureidoglycolate dehydrogenase